jgi:hypothetical protein
MAQKRKPAGQIYQLKLQGRLDENWSEWFSGMTISVKDWTLAKSNLNNMKISHVTGRQ